MKKIFIATVKSIGRGILGAIIVLVFVYGCILIYETFNAFDPSTPYWVSGVTGFLACLKPPKPKNEGQQ